LYTVPREYKFSPGSQYNPSYTSSTHPDRIPRPSPGYRTPNRYRILLGLINIRPDPEYWDEIRRLKVEEEKSKSFLNLSQDIFINTLK